MNRKEAPMFALKLFPALLVGASLFADGPSGVRLTGKIESLPAAGVVGNWTVRPPTFFKAARAFFLMLLRLAME